MVFRIDDLPADELRAALSVDLDERPLEEAMVIQDFIQRIGGRENARAAVDMLDEIDDPYPRRFDFPGSWMIDR